MRNYKNYFRDLSNELLKEELTVIVKRTGSPESDPPLFSSEKIPESVEDDLLWVLDRYKRSKFEKAPFKVKDKKGREVFAKAEDGKKKLLKLTPEASQEFSKVAAELQNYSGGTLDIDRLQQVIDPWGQSGFDALLRILTVTRRINRNKSEGDYFSFPFFKYENNVKLEGTVPLPSMNDGVPVELEKFLLSVRPGDKGTGELLFSLLVGGLVDQNVVADVLVGTEFWEMKDMTYGEIRLGDASSNEFKNSFPRVWEEIIDLGEDAGEPVALSFSSFLDRNLRTITAYEKFRNSGSAGVPDFLKDAVVERLDVVLHNSMKHSDSATKVTGVVGYVGGADGFKMFPVESFTLSRIGKPFRVMARLK